MRDDESQSACVGHAIYDAIVANHAYHHMMRVVIDTNRLEDDELRIFLSADRENKAVLPEHTMAEVFKPRSLEAIYSQFLILSDFPKQVIVLKGNRHILKVRADAPAIANRFINRDETRAVPKFYKAISAAKAGNVGYQRQQIERHQWSIERVETALIELGDQSEAFAELRDAFGPEDLRRLAAKEPSTNRFRTNLMGTTDYLASRLREGRTGLPLMEPPARYYDFTWRYALCHLVQALGLVAKGAVRRKPDKSANDHFDNVFATFGTYFNGLMTMDFGPLATQAIARIILKSLGVRLAEDYTESGYILSTLGGGED